MNTMTRILLSSSLLFLHCGGAAEIPSRPTHPVAGEAAKPEATPPSKDAEALAGGRRWVTAFYERRTQAVWDAMSDGMRRLLVDKAGLDAFRRSIDEQLGPESSVVEEKVVHEGGVAQYVRVARFEKSSATFDVVVGTSGARIEAFGIVPSKPLEPAPTTKLDYKTRSRLRLPFDGAWTVAWGGRTLEQNQHVVMRDQRFAYDFLITKAGKTHRGEGSANGDYYCYGQKVLAPAAGRIISAVDGVPENLPGQMDAEHPAGNYVIIDHGGDEYSLLAHLQPRSLTQKTGDAVTAGQVLGRCGNSGHSSEPHLHYQLQSGPKFADADGLPAQFRDYIADGIPVATGEPVRDQTIQSAERARPRAGRRGAGDGHSRAKTRE